MCCFLARHLPLLVYDKDWLAQCQDNATEWNDAGSLVSQRGSTINHHEGTLSQVGIRPDMTLDVARR